MELVEYMISEKEVIIYHFTSFPLTDCKEIISHILNDKAIKKHKPITSYVIKWCYRFILYKLHWSKSTKLKLRI